MKNSRWAALLLTVVGCAGPYDGEDMDDLEAAADSSALDWSEDVEQLGVSAHALTTGDHVRLEAVRHCRNKAFCNSRLSSEDYRPWDNHNVAEAKQKNTYIAHISSPPRDQVENLVFLSAGQQFWDADPFDSGHFSSITGQPNGWHQGWDKTHREKYVEITSSLLTEVVNEHFDSSNSFVAAAFDARFNHEFSPGNKQEIVNAYFDWLESKFDPGKLKVIYLAGHSRGGCLAMRLAQRFNEKYPSRPIIVHSFDGVCNKDDGELGLTRNGIFNVGDRIYNAAYDHGKRYWGWATDITRQFAHPESLEILHLAGGEPVVFGQLADVHTFSHHEATQTTFDNGWYRQIWVDATHGDVDDWPYRRDFAHPHLRENLAKMRCPDAKVWMGGECRPRCSRPVSKWNGSQQAASFDGANCYVERVPEGKEPFIYDNRYYVKPSPGCKVGSYDGANCFVHGRIAGSSFFIWDGALYATRVNGSCPIGRFDGANCYIMHPPAGSTGFVWDGNLYVTSTPTCSYGNYDGANCYVGHPPGGTSAFLWDRNFYYAE